MSRLNDVTLFVDQSRRCRSADDLRGLMEGITAEMGFHVYALYQHVRRFDWGNANLLAISNYPRPWLEYLFEHRLDADDPVHLASCRTALGFRFDEMPSLLAMTARHRDVMEAAARRGGIADGFCVPCHIPGEAHGTCTFAVRQAAPLPAANLHMAQLVGRFAYEAARALQRSGAEIVKPVATRPGRSRPERNPGPPRRLTQRQLECLVLSSRGKSDWEIARILGIGQETVKHHMRMVREHYDVSTRIQAAVHAVLAEDLSLTDLIS
ncbi:MAG: LuxR family transcriptional regulator [Allosphingosinicella sp.]